MSVGFQAADDLLLGQRIGRHLLGIVNTPHDDRLVGVAFEKVDDDLLTDTRDINDTPLFPGP